MQWIYIRLVGFSNSIWKYYQWVSLISYIPVREQLKELTKKYDKSENDLKALQSVGQVSEGLNFNNLDINMLYEAVLL